MTTHIHLNTQNGPLFFRIRHVAGGRQVISEDFNFSFLCPHGELLYDVIIEQLEDFFHSDCTNWL